MRIYLGLLVVTYLCLTGCGQGGVLSRDKESEAKSQVKGVENVQPKVQPKRDDNKVIAESWAIFVDTAKARIVTAEGRWKMQYPAGSQQIRFVSNDVKKTESIATPIIGEVVITVTDDYGPNEQRQQDLKFNAMRSGIIRARDQTLDVNMSEARRKQRDDELADIKKSRAEIEGQSIRLFSDNEYMLKFAFRDEAWIFIEGTRKLIDETRHESKDIGKSNHITKLGDELRILFP